MITAHDLLTRTAALLSDTAALQTAAGLGFVAGAAVVDDALAQMTSSWSVVDARKGDSGAVRTRIVAAFAEKKPIALALELDHKSEKTAPLSALLFAQAAAD